ncbi:hypothetical protein GCM10010276_25860 [Streptomyces longisporus]|uniref:Secreted protein n=1 Tax=Streptomyces longisporus TaxID=1948 RepID=A0ABP5YW97_STRLO
MRTVTPARVASSSIVSVGSSVSLPGSLSVSVVMCSSIAVTPVLRNPLPGAREACEKYRCVIYAIAWAPPPGGRCRVGLRLPPKSATEYVRTPERDPLGRTREWNHL